MTSKIKVDNINKVSDDSNIIKKCGSTITIGSCGASVALACGATQTGFGRTGTVDWCTTAKTSPFTAVSGDGFFVNTTGGAITVTLPSSPSAGDIISLKDYANTWDTNGVTLCRNSSKINGVCANAVLNTESQSVTLIYVDGTKGWQDIQDSTSNVKGNAFITATGGCISTCGDYKIHTFNASSNFVVSASPTPANAIVEYLVVGGGGSGGSENGQSVAGGGGGAGGFRFASPSIAPLTYPAKPLAGPSTLPVSVQSYPVVVGAGGATDPVGTNPGNVSTFSSITSAGGGGGGFTGGPNPGPRNGESGGSGGGSSHGTSSPVGGGTGNTPPVSPAQGTNGGGATPGTYLGGGGGGGTTVGTRGGNQTGPGGPGGGLPTAFGSNGQPCGSFRYYSGGGGGGGSTNRPETGPAGTGGLGGGAAGGAGQNPAPAAGTTNTGGGGGGAGNQFPNPGTPLTGSNGGSGVVIIRYKFQ